MFIYTTGDYIADLKERLVDPEGEYAFLRFELERAAQLAVKKGPWSVTYSPTEAVSGDPHDYYSIGTYWWPDPNAADPSKVPYIRRDGEVNPEKFRYNHRQDFIALSQEALTLCVAGYLFDRREYLDRAAELFRVWFVDEETKMNPHLEYGQAIKNICTGRASGIIELHSLDRIVFTLPFLEVSGGYDSLLAKMNDWIAAMLNWLLTSNHGLEEEKNGNNHETYYNVHIGQYALWLGRNDVLDRMCKNYKERIVPKQIEPDGAMIRELGRTRSLHYSLFNLDAMSLVCELGRAHGVDLWNFKVGERCISKAIDYHVPALKSLYTWRFPEIDGEVPDYKMALQFAAMRLNRNELSDVNKGLREGKRLWRAQGPICPPCLLEGFKFDSDI